MALMQVDIMQGQVRGLERGEPLARRGVREGRMIDTTRYKTWRSTPSCTLSSTRGRNFRSGYQASGRGWDQRRVRAVEFKTEGDMQAS
jgi:hypothetical protein